MAKFKIKHDCILGNRCEKYKVTLQSSNPIVYTEKGKVISSSMHYMSGHPEDLDSFIKDLKNDNKVISVERKSNMFFLLEKAKEKAVQFITPKLIFTKPVLQDTGGYETWEVASWERKEIENFVKKVEKSFENYKLLKFIELKIDNIFFPRLMPNLTDKQKRAVELAIHEGYYLSPRRVGLRKLASIMNISLSTYEQHLRAAEEKLIPNLLYYTA